MMTEMKKSVGVMEKLKASDSMKWVGLIFS